MTRAELERGLEEFVNARLVAHPAPAVDRETLLFEDGVLNSLRILELIAFLEGALGRRIPDTAIRLANFRSIRTIANAFLPEEPHAAA